MSYLRKIKYRIVPDESFDIVYNCSGCGCKTSYKNTNRFRVNANGNKLDVWLIYQCSKCKHTKNLAIYERQNPARIPQEEYQLFLANDEELAKEYGRNFQFFMKNHVEVDHEAIRYHYEMEAGRKKYRNRSMLSSFFFREKIELENHARTCYNKLRLLLLERSEQ